MRRVRLNIHLVVFKPRHLQDVKNFSPSGLEWFPITHSCPEKIIRGVLSMSHFVACPWFMPIRPKMVKRIFWKIRQRFNFLWPVFFCRLIAAKSTGYPNEYALPANSSIALSAVFDLDEVEWNRTSCFDSKLILISFIA